MPMQDGGQGGRRLADDVPVGLYRADPQGTILEGNTALVALLGLPDLSALVGRNFAELFADPTTRARWRERIDKEGEAHRFGFLGRRGDGALLWLETTAHSVRDAAGKVLFHVGSLEDVTARERVQERRRQMGEQRHRSQKMEAVGRLAGGVAHDFGNLLTVVAGRAELLLMSLDGSDPRREHATEILRAAEKATTLTRRLLAFSRHRGRQDRLLGVNAVVADAEPLLQRVLGRGVELVLDLAPDLAPVRADPIQVEQVILNLVVNSRDALPEGGRIVLRTANVRPEAEPPPEAGPEAQVMIEVSDTGVGMDAATLEHIFEPFFTTKAHSTGLGLSTVYAIVRQSAGHVAVESQPGRGATFRVYLPQAVETAPITPAR